MKHQCSTCKARVKKIHEYKFRLVCHDCMCEYKTIFEGWVSNNTRKKIDHEKKEEKEKTTSKIPQEILKYFQDILLDQKEESNGTLD